MSFRIKVSDSQKLRDHLKRVRHAIQKVSNDAVSKSAVDRATKVFKIIQDDDDLEKYKTLINTRFIPSANFITNQINQGFLEYDGFIAIVCLYFLDFNDMVKLEYTHKEFEEFFDILDIEDLQKDNVHETLMLLIDLFTNKFKEHPYKQFAKKEYWDRKPPPPVKPKKEHSTIMSDILQRASLFFRKNRKHVSKVFVLSIVVFLTWVSVKSYLQPFTQTILIHFEGKPFKNSASSQSIIYMNFGKEILSKELDENGFVSFSEIPSVYLNDEFSLDIQIEDFVMKDGKSKYSFSKNLTIVEIVKDPKLSVLSGYIQDGNDFSPIMGVELYLVELDTSVWTDSTGKFTLKVPLDNVKSKYNVQISKSGYKSEEEYFAPSDNFHYRIFKND